MPFEYLVKHWLLHWELPGAPVMPSWFCLIFSFQFSHLILLLLMDKGSPFFLGQGAREEVKRKESRPASAWLWALGKTVILNKVTLLLN